LPWMVAASSTMDRAPRREPRPRRQRKGRCGETPPSSTLRPP
jgi:hypothetical protein